MSKVSDPKLWKKIKEKWHKGGKGGKAGQWNARKAQLAVKEYKEKGGEYIGKKKKDNSLSVWTKEDWGYIDGDKKGRYLPKNVRLNLTPAEKKLENKLKRSATKKGKQKASWSKSVNKKFKTYGGMEVPKVRPVVKNGKLFFSDHPEFRPNRSPRQIFKAGAFGGTYWRVIQSRVTKMEYEDMHLEFPASWWKGIPEEDLTSSECDKSRNKYGVKSGTSLRAWEKSKWIKEQDPYGWVQWYCRFCKGRRTEDDDRQIKRWLAFAGPTGRFRVRLINMCKKARKKYNDYSVSPVIRQGLLQWGYELVKADF